MKELYIMRHGASEPISQSYRDEDRNLNPEGKTEAEEIGEVLHRRNILPEQIVCSTAVRAKSTALIVAAKLGYAPERIDYMAMLYNADLDTLTKIVREFNDNFRKVLLIGHNPGLTEFIDHLLEEEHVALDTCGVWALRSKENHWSNLLAGKCNSLFYECPYEIQFTDQNKINK